MRQLLTIPALITAIGATLVLAGCGSSRPAADCGKLQVNDAWVAPAHAGSREMLGFFSLHNAGSQPVIVNGVSSDAFDRAIFQDKADAANDDDGSAKLLKSFTVAGRKNVKFVPGKREVALYSPSRAYRAGDKVHLTLVCGRQHAPLKTTAVVRDRNGDLMPINANSHGATDRQQVLKDGRNGGGSGAADDSKTAH